MKRTREHSNLTNTIVHAAKKIKKEVGGLLDNYVHISRRTYNVPVCKRNTRKTNYVDSIACNKMEKVDRRYQKLLKKLISLSECCARAIFKCFDQLLQELTDYFEGNSEYIDKCMKLLVPYMDVYHLCRSLKILYENALHMTEATVTDRMYYNTISKIIQILTRYYEVYDKQVITPPYPLPKGDIPIRQILKTLLELPYFLHRDMFVLIERFMATNNCKHLSGICALRDCLADSLDVHCISLRSEVNTLCLKSADNIKEPQIMFDNPSLSLYNYNYFEQFL